MASQIASSIAWLDHGIDKSVGDGLGDSSVDDAVHAGRVWRGKQSHVGEHVTLGSSGQQHGGANRATAVEGGQGVDG